MTLTTPVAVKKPVSQELSFTRRTVKNVVSGTISGIAGCIVGHPFDTLKVCHFVASSPFLAVRLSKKNFFNSPT